MLTAQTKPTTNMTAIQLQEIRRQLGLTCVNKMVKAHLIQYIKRAQSAL